MTLKINKNKTPLNFKEPSSSMKVYWDQRKACHSYKYSISGIHLTTFQLSLTLIAS